MRLLCGLVCLAAMLGPSISAQSAPAKSFTYDVVSIKPNNSGSGSSRTSMDGERFLTTNVSFRSLLAIAYNVKEDQIIGVPKELDGAHFDVLAKSLNPDPKAWSSMNNTERGAMLQPILAARFRLKAHAETRTLPMYELVIDKSGPKFKDVPANEHTGHMSTGNKQIIGSGISIGALAKVLAETVHREVIDKTGLNGSYDISLQWTPDGADQSDGPPGIFTAVQDQLGLKLRAAKGPVQVLVVDAALVPVAD